MAALLRAAAAPDYPAEITLALTNRPDAPGLGRAAEYGAPTAVIDHKAFGKGDAGRLAFEAEMAARLDAAAVDYICLAGFMRLLTADFVEARAGRIINIHPTLLPSFPGLHVHERMIDAGVKIAGCTVHFVTAEMDAGPIIGQAALAVAPDDTADTLSARILQLEHRLYPACLRAVIEGDAAPSLEASLFNPPA